MTIGILKEPEFESRVAMLPETVQDLKKLKVDVLIESGAGMKASQPDETFSQAGASIESRETVLKMADLLISIHAISSDELDQTQAKCVLISVYNPLVETEMVKQLQAKGKTAFSLDLIPRTTRGQAMDILSSMATVSGYKAVLEAAMQLPKFFPMFMTAAGTIKPAKMLILGAGVAGLQAIAVGRKLGAQVSVFDVRSAVKEQVMSLGGKFVEVEGAKDDASAGGYAVEQTEEFKKKQQEMIQEHAKKSDVIICTAQIPGKKAPVLITKDTIEHMQEGSVIVDLAASTGGNTALTKNDETIVHHGVKIIGQSNYPSTMPMDASRMFGKNLYNLLKLMIDEEANLKLDFEDEIISGCCVTHEKNIVNERVKSLIQ